jgi:hypothetical protein
MASLLIFVGCEGYVSMVQRVSGVGVTDGSSLMGLSVSACATVLLLTAGRGLFVQGRMIVLVLFVVA